jgi:outer membrane lipoprotein carrier protein
MQDIGYGVRDGCRKMRILRPASCVPVLLCLSFCFLSGPPGSCASDLDGIVARFQQHYASVVTVTGDFKQTYRAPGIDQVESGVFWLKKPAFMRWEYRSPEEKLFIADGRESFLYVPLDRQVTVQPFSALDLQRTPLELLLGKGNINKSFAVSWEPDLKSNTGLSYVIRLTPRKSEAEYSFLVVELDQKTYDLRRILIRESSSNASEFVFTNVSTNIKIEKKMFQFKAPKGVEILRLNNEQ